jgi:hypothetical protein
MNELERAELEAENDGYRNEYQRAAAWSAMQPKNDDLGHAKRLSADGYCVAVAFTPRYCPVTDAVIGEYCTLISHASSPKLVHSALASLDLDPETRIEIWNDEPVAPPAPAPVADDDVPF